MALFEYLYPIKYTINICLWWSQTENAGKNSIFLISYFTAVSFDRYEWSTDRHIPPGATDTPGQRDTASVLIQHQLIKAPLVSAAWMTLAPLVWEESITMAPLVAWSTPAVRVRSTCWGVTKMSMLHPSLCNPHATCIKVLWVMENFK